MSQSSRKMAKMTSPNPVEWAAVAGKLDTLKLLMKAQEYDPKQIGYNGRNLLTLHVPGTLTR